MKGEDPKKQILNYINELIWYTETIAKDKGFEVPSRNISSEQLELLLNQKFWLLWDIKNFIEEEQEGDNNASKNKSE